jgi:membrane carboxypeptidase/penicillin-binding protein
VTGVWVGFDQPKTIVPNGYAADLAVPIWGVVHEGGDEGRKARLVRASGRTSSA